MKVTKKVFLGAIERLVQRGWHRATPGSIEVTPAMRGVQVGKEDDCGCLATVTWDSITALGADPYFNEKETAFEAENYLRRAIGLPVPQDKHAPTNDIYAWNDAPERTFAEVLSVLGKAAMEAPES